VLPSLTSKTPKHDSFHWKLILHLGFWFIFLEISRKNVSATSPTPCPTRTRPWPQCRWAADRRPTCTSRATRCRRPPPRSTWPRPAVSHAVALVSSPAPRRRRLRPHRPPPPSTRPTSGIRGNWHWGAMLWASPCCTISSGDVLFYWYLAVSMIDHSFCQEFF